MIRLAKYMKPYVVLLACAVALLFLQAQCELALPGYMAHIVNDGVIFGHINVIAETGGVMLLVTFVAAAASVVVGFLAARIAAGVSRDLRLGVFEKVQRFSHTEFDTFSTASLITRTTNDITQIQMVLVMVIRLAFYAPILGAGAVLKALSRDASMSWIIGAALLCMIGTVLILFTLVTPKFKLIQQLIDRLNQVVRENLSGILVVRAFNTQTFENNRFDTANRDLAGTTLFVNRAMVLMMPVMMLIMNVVSVIIVWVGAHQVASLQLNIGDMMAYIQYSMQIIMSFLMLSAMFILVPRAAVSGDRVAEVLAARAGITDPEHPIPFDADFKPTVEFRGVHFAYPGGEDYVLRDINFTARPGQTTAIIGPTGSGKSTLINLVMRFYDVSSGQVLVDGKDVRAVSRRDLRDKIGYVPQKSVLFAGTVRSNLAYGDRDASREEIEAAAVTAQAAEFITAMKGGYEAVIAQGGANVSGGQKQRLSIARALVKNAPIYIFDDSFSALDLRTDRNLRAALKKVTAHSTILMVAQRVGTIMNADQIIVLDNGRIAGCGTHRELLRDCTVYREIVYSQLGEEALAR